MNSTSKNNETQGPSQKKFGMANTNVSKPLNTTNGNILNTTNVNSLNTTNGNTSNTTDVNTAITTNVSTPNAPNTTKLSINRKLVQDEDTDD
jgi:hypothetical protein